MTEATNGKDVHFSIRS